MEKRPHCVGASVTAAKQKRGECAEEGIALGDVGVVPVSALPQVVSAWRAPSHPEFQPRNSWSLCDAFTEALNGNLPFLPRSTQALHGLMDSPIEPAGRN